jgi:hypothetical protein
MAFFAAIGVALGASAATAAFVGVVAVAVVGAAIGGIAAAITGGSILKGMLFGAVGSVVAVAGAGLAAGAGAGAGGAAAGAGQATTAAGWAGSAGEALATGYGVGGATAAGSAAGSAMTLSQVGSQLFSTDGLQVIGGVAKAGGALLKADVAQSNADRERALYEKKIDTEKELAEKKLSLDAKDAALRERQYDTGLSLDREKMEAHDKSILEASQGLIAGARVGSPSVIRSARANITRPTWKTGQVIAGEVSRQQVPMPQAPQAPQAQRPQQSLLEAV